MIALLKLPFSFMILLWQSVMLALSQIWANKLRGVLTTLGILIGVAAVSSVIALISGMRDRVLAEFDAFGARRIVIQPQWRQKDMNKGAYENVVFKNSDFDEMLERCPSTESFTRDAPYGRMGASHGTDVDEEARFHSVDPSWHEIQLQDVDKGRPITEMDLQQVRRVCLVNQRIVEKLKLNADPTGQFINVPYFGRLMIVGSLEPPPGMSAADLRSGEVVVPFTFSTHKYFWPTWYTVTVNSKSREQTKEAAAEIEFYLRQKRHIAPDEEPTFRIETSERQIDQINETAKMVTTIAGGIVAVSLLVAGVGIMNIMLVSVSERTREIGLRKAVGARPGAICLQFLLEAVVLCLIGGILGVILGQVITTIVSSQLPAMREHGKLIHIDHLVVPPSAIALSLGFSALIGLTFGFFPAIKAASLDPIEALRHE